MGEATGVCPWRPARFRCYNLLIPDDCRLQDGISGGGASQTYKAVVAGEYGLERCKAKAKRAAGIRE
jgi:hypothetical protein